MDQGPTDASGRRRYPRIVDEEPKGWLFDGTAPRPHLAPYFPNPKVDSTTSALVKISNIAACTAAALAMARGTSSQLDLSTFKPEYTSHVRPSGGCTGLMLVSMSKRGQRMAGFTRGFVATFPIYLVAFTIGGCTDFALSKTNRQRTFEFDLP